MAPKKGKASSSQQVDENSLRNALYAVRLQNMRTRMIHPVWSIDLDDVDGSDIVRQVEGMGWR
ncbi:hypothetical protein Ddye_030158 [Dipteronia dyeriana]|uniref:Uncharacterized protein n=1 Tax=Dipteronia dyeriana TaxID=168575 RepID=A0AAD9TG73_9ROSI|nr:hypothetical protein Ddye_030158 [Dipteronia dyeriana]